MPLALFFWGDRWLLAAWCGLRLDYRSFRVDRLQSWRDTNLSCPPDVSLAGYLGHVDSDGRALAWLERHQRQPWHQE
ncbi:WYL domain-containing protein [Chromobacterium haemolyticum]|uniref:WYL domain-containing protein n=1 Tax=Chromobacterium haemolyticum TaxID=394935 RepID=UPI0002D3B4A1|nr:WYL domain-containing protein [Chromobacterium haemolyticum]